jgi:hypothetical protein
MLGCGMCVCGNPRALSHLLANTLQNNGYNDPFQNQSIKSPFDK